MYNNVSIIRSIFNRMKHRVNLNPVDFSYLSTDDRLKGNDNDVDC